MAESRPDVIVVGGGIGGLFAANALIAQGLHVSVYEQAPALGEVGAGVFLTPNSVRQLQRVGLGPSVAKWGAKVGPDSRYFRHDGTPIAPVQVTDSSGWNATFGMHRADLVEILANALPTQVVHTGHRCTGFEQDGEGARVSFRMEPLSKATSSSLPMASTPSFGRTWFLPPVRSSLGLSPTAAWYRMSSFRTGRLGPG